jgi:hypothetical protein
MRMMLSNEAPDGGTSLSLASPFFGLQRLAVMLRHPSSMAYGDA